LAAHNPADPKRSLFSLGVLLLELAFAQTLESQPFRKEFLLNGEPNEFTNLCTAKKWHEQVEPEFGDGIADAIRRCLDCAFGPVADFDNDQFSQAILDDVIYPLESFVSLWKGGRAL
jgi:hypothetical protein